LADSDVSIKGGHVKMVLTGRKEKKKRGAELTRQCFHWQKNMLLP